MKIDEYKTQLKQCVNKGNTMELRISTQLCNFQSYTLFKEFLLKKIKYILCCFGLHDVCSLKHGHMSRICHYCDSKNTYTLKVNKNFS